MRRTFAAAAALALAGALAAAGPPPATPAAPPGAAPADDAEDFVYLGEGRPVLVRLHPEVDGRPLRAVWEDFVGQVFKYADADGDGVLSRAEAERAPPPAVLLGGGFPGNIPLPTFDALDSDKNGKVTRAELAAYYRRSGAGPFHFRAGGADAMDGRAGRVRIVGAGGSGPRPSADALNEALFKLLDADGDGKLSAAELAAAPAALAKLDADDDEMVSARELLGEPAPPADGALAVAFVADGAPGPDPASPFVAAARGRPDKALAQRLLARYAPKGAKGPARKLTAKDIGLSAGAFAALDADGDGALDAEELARFAERPADFEFRVRLGKRAGGRPVFEPVDAAGRPAAPAGLTTTPDGHAVLDLLGVTRIEFGTGGETAGMTFKVSSRQQYLSQFKAADRDNNGYLDRSEAMQSPFFRNTFKLMDRDGDGKLFEKELVAYLDKVEVLQEAAQKSCVSLTVADQGRGLFDVLDTNRDGRLGVRELRQAGKLLARLDRDGDGKISRNEIPRSYQVNLRQGASGNFGGDFVVAFAPGGGMQEPPRPEPSAGPLWFRKMDRNRDGDVSRREFLGSDEEFRRLDLDGDGLISLEEAVQADRALRGAKARGR
jgi:Ca2+-binding EF-hand superfamily protein